MKHIKKINENFEDPIEDNPLENPKVEDYLNVIKNNSPEVAASILFNNTTELTKYGMGFIVDMVRMRLNHYESKTEKELKEDIKVVLDFLNKFDDK